MVSRDHRYDLVVSMYEKGRVRSFNDIFKYIPKSIVAKDLGMKVDRFNKLMNRVKKFTFEDMELIADFCEMEFDIMLELWKKEYQLQKETISPGNNNKK